LLKTLPNNQQSQIPAPYLISLIWQPGPDSIGIVAISHGCTGVAARACGLVGLEPTRVSSPGF
jgi:hypothetical protein